MREESAELTPEEMVSELRKQELLADPALLAEARRRMAEIDAKPPMQRALEHQKTAVIMECRRRWRESSSEPVREELSALERWVAGLVTGIIDPASGSSRGGET
jgi:hypothetical protein